MVRHDRRRFYHTFFTAFLSFYFSGKRQKSKSQVTSWSQIDVSEGMSKPGGSGPAGQAGISATRALSDKLIEDLRQGKIR